MSRLPRAITNLIEKFERLPGIGPKSASRLVFYLIHVSEGEVADFAKKLTAIKREIVLCETCHHISESPECTICADKSRDQTQLMVLEQPLDLIAIEDSGQYKGLYHILHGSIEPLSNIGPDQLYLSDILKRLEGVEEMILATNPTMEGEATALYIKELVEKNSHRDIKITRIGHGLPIGADIEYADRLTLSRALEGRREI